jgi:hypothetical protein
MFSTMPPFIGEAASPEELVSKLKAAHIADQESARRVYTLIDTATGRQIIRNVMTGKKAQSQNNWLQQCESSLRWV